MRRASRPAVWVLTNTRDLAADHVVALLNERDVSVFRLNADQVVSEAVVPWRPDHPPVTTGAVWWRQFEAFVEPTEPLSLEQAEDLLVRRAQWRTWLAVLAEPGIRWMNPLWAARRAENKVEQLRIATKLGGVAVPETLVTNDPHAVREFDSASPAIIKTLAAAYYEFTDSGFVYTHAAASVTAPDEAWLRQPLICQRRLQGAHVRVIQLSRHTFAGCCESDMLDWRRQEQPTLWRDWTVPHAVRSFCLDYLEHTGLEYAAFDFIDDGDRVWFLEANQAGEWVFLDRALGLGLAGVIATHLEDLGTDRQ
jgi:hypothetical protein